ncbi:MAG TPA: SIR2 family protein [Thiobacillus sp.]|nr:MAG: hypothetical protein B7Y21_09335 [Hydrogenophilales bacterium 16-61-112]OZA44252.1 MAG: hypothetical protein B7X81_10165 [Hydrogenophilales bacterium 17-61-76]HQT31579.1 SIR2 family protein [Thiobacillus sp.]HQT71076.1 SIR2 family protein [Thiobacillus sp.]
MALLNNDPMTQLAFSVYENKGVFAVLIGSGLSRSAEIPTGWEITLDLIRRVAMAQGVAEQPDWAAWYRDKTGGEPNYSSLLEEIASSPEERRSVLHSYIEPTEADRDEGKKIPTSAHLAIAQLVRSGFIRVIITTNFDRLMENALREHGVEPTVISSIDALQGAEPLTHSQCYILKLHGDYKDARILNTDGELSAYPEEYNRLLDRIFDEHGLIVCGWSGEWDHALRSAILRAPNRRYPTYWATRNNLNDGADAIVANKHAKVIRIANADDLFVTLKQRIETLEKTHRQNPLSTELLVGSAKRYLAKPEYRIQLDELFSREMERLLAQLESASLEAHTSWTSIELSERVRLYEAIAEPIARMAGVLGRWGNGDDLGQVLDIIWALYAEAEKVGNGLTVWIGMRSYPAVLVFTAYGLGLTRAQRWQTLHQLFSASLSREYHEPETIVSALFLWSWKGGDNDAWKHYEGLTNRKTALSDHLLELMSEWKSSFIGIEPNYEVLFERFESLGSLACFEENDEADLEKAKAARPNEIFARMPVGRIGWHSSSFKRIEQEFGNEATIQVLLNAGFAKGKRRVFDLFLENFRRAADRMKW